MRIYLTTVSDFLKNKKGARQGLEMTALRLERIFDEETERQTLVVKAFYTPLGIWSTETPFILWEMAPSNRFILFCGRLLTAQPTDEENIWQLRFVETSVEGIPLSKVTFCRQADDALDLTPFIFEDSLTIQETQPPRCLRLTLQAEWLQKLGGVLDLGSSVSALFPKGHVSSLNRTFGTAQFEGAKSGYTLLEASFEVERPPATGALGVYPTTTPSLDFIPQKRGTKKPPPLVLPRYWFRAVWRVAWLYEQKRIETLVAEIPLNPNGEGELDIRLKVPNVETLEGFDESVATLESLWPILFKNVETELKADLAMRFQEKIGVAVPFEIGLKLALGQLVQVHWAGQTLQGHIQTMSFTADGVQREVRLILQSTAGWFNEWMKRMWKLDALQICAPIEGLVKPLSPEDAILDGTVENDAETQFALLAKRTWTSPREIVPFLKEHATRVDLRLRDLRTHKHLEQALIAKITLE